jgi:hypothetical protein
VSSRYIRISNKENTANVHVGEVDPKRPSKFYSSKRFCIMEI